MAASQAPTALRYGVYLISVGVLVYYFGVRFFVDDRQRHDLIFAVAVVAVSALLAVVVLSSVSYEAILGYLYGIVIGAALFHYVGKYRRVTA